MELNEWIRAVRSKLGVSQQSFAEMFSVTKGNVSSWEHGRHEPSFRQIMRMAELSSTLPPGIVGENVQFVKDVTEISHSANSASVAHDAQSSAPRLVTYEMIKDAVSGVLNAMGVQFADLVGDERDAKQRIEMTLAKDGPQVGMRNKTKTAVSGGSSEGFGKNRDHIDDGTVGQKRKPA